MPHLAYLSKSDFKTGRECPAKLWYKKRHYPSTNEDNEFLKYLAENGHIVGKIAQMRYPEGQLIKTLNLEEAAEQTANLLQQEDVVIFEPLVSYGPLLARVDVLIKRGKQCQLIEVKAKKAPKQFTTKKGDRVSADWQPYIEDVAFQLMLARASLPDLEFTPYLMLTDGDSLAQEAKLPSCFDVRKEGRSCEVDFKGNPEQREQLLNFLTLREVSAEVASVEDAVTKGAQELMEVVDADAPHPRPALSAVCAKCEYRVATEITPNGFLECWGELAKPDPHIFDLFKRDLLKGGGNKTLNKLISEGRTSLYDVAEDEWGDKKKDYRKRQIIQVESLQNGAEWIDPALREVIETATYPLQFIDFEFDRPAIPHVPGIGPWGQIVFQWSLHRIAAPGAACEHSEFLDTTGDDPHLPFLQSLRTALDLEGTVLIWSGAEFYALRDLVTGREDPEIEDWLQRLIAKDGPLLDMEELTKRHHFHIEMKHQTTIKKVFPPAWRGCQAVETLPECTDFLELDDKGQRKDPYKLIAERHPDFPVAEGTGAVLAYHELLDGRLSTEAATKIRQQLLDYCRLDTLAMRIIWAYWEERLVR